MAAPGEPVRLSGSQLDRVLGCPRQWFLARQAHGESARSTAASFGSVIHVLAQHGASGEVDPRDLAGHLESVWSQLTFDANWLSAVERVEAESALERFATWQEARAGQQLLGTEVPFATQLDLGAERIQLTGSADRVERDPDGRIRIVDFKTSKTPPTGAEVARQDQLGVYQLAVQQGAFAAVAGPDARPGGAELVYLRLSDGPGTYPRVFQQASLDDVPFPAGRPAGPGRPDDPAGEPGPPTWVHERLAEAARIIRDERFEARPSSRCRYCPFRTSCPAQSAGRQVVT